eukprot:TRINITY_DN1259_c0_g1_i3.p1 TRINITY_DN1259_c0_g1~~TRINITY_DN1259_c0_g1_i3.p1  ORF type:complete len:179 (+),score=8.78 TRINITY_DN1259_c0_g1_i3:659-1195(+)
MAPSDGGMLDSISGSPEQLVSCCLPQSQVAKPTEAAKQGDVAGAAFAAIDIDYDLGATPIQSPDATPTANAPGLAPRTPDTAQRAPLSSCLQDPAGAVSLPEVKVLVSSARSKGSVRGERVFRRNAGRVCRSQAVARMGMYEVAGPLHANREWHAMLHSSTSSSWVALNFIHSQTSKL